MRLDKKEIDELLGKMPIQFHIFGIPGTDYREFRPYTYLEALRSDSFEKQIEFVESLIRAKIAEAMNPGERGKTFDGDWLLVNGWKFDDNVFYLPLSNRRRLEMGSFTEPVELQLRSNEDYTYQILCYFKNDGTRGPIMDLLRVLER